MSELIAHSGWLAVMFVLIGCSAFFSSSEAALFFLSPRDRREFARGNPAQRAAAHLLNDPERLLGAVLFWNLVVNIAYFAVASIVGTRLEGSAAWLFPLAALLTMILLSEMLPKSLAVLRPRMIAAANGIPLAATVAAIDFLMPMLRTVNLLSRRLLWPTLEPEPFLELSDLERAVELSSADETQRGSQRAVLQSIVSLSDLRVDEVMRPRMLLKTFRPPVTLADVQSAPPMSGYLLVTEPVSDEITAAVSLDALANSGAIGDEASKHQNLEQFARPAVFVPWCTSASVALELMRQHGRRVAVVVNEFGETIGLLTTEDVLNTVFSESPSRTGRLFNRVPIREVRPETWQVTGMTTVRRLSRHFRRPMPMTKSITMAGVVQESLERMPQVGDAGSWGDFQFKVVEAAERGPLLVELKRVTRRQSEREAGVGR